MSAKIIGKRVLMVGVAPATACSLALALTASVPASADEDQGTYTPGKTSLVEVRTQGKTDVQHLVELGLDVVTRNGQSVEVLLQDTMDAATLRGAGKDWDVVVADVAATNSMARAKEADQAQQLEMDQDVASGLPTGRVSYRDLDEVNAELKTLARQYPETVRLIELPRRSLLGRAIYAVEVTHNVGASVGKPVFTMEGLTHSREWPTAELTLEFIWDLAQNDGKDTRITSLLEAGRLLAIPVVNPDGYVMSRSLIQEQKRKNCRVKDGRQPTFKQCANPKNFAFGVDLNRNYNVFWGGPGAGADPATSNYRGAEPKSEPEIQNMIDLLADHQVTVAISNHTPDARVLRAPSAPNEPVPAEEELYQGLAEKLGEIMDWPAGPWPKIYYDASGTAEQTAFYSAGTLAFTFENTPGNQGNDRFHPPYPFVIDQYLGQGAYAGSNGREAYLTAFESAIDPRTHSIITGEAPSGAELTISKNVPLYTSAIEGLFGDAPGVIPFRTKLRSTITVPTDGAFTWHVTPSTRPSQAFTAKMQESWTVTCAGPEGAVQAKVKVTVDRGESISIPSAELKDCPRVVTR